MTMFRRLAIGLALLLCGVAPVAAQVTIGVARVAANTSTGNQAITVSMGGATPVAALIMATSATTDATAAAHAVLGVGWAVSTSSRVAFSAESQDNVTPINIAQALSTSLMVKTYTGAGAGTQDAAADFVSFGADTVTINWSDAPAAAVYLHVVAWYSASMSAYNGSVGLGTGTSAIDVTSPGFEPDAVIAMYRTGDLTNSWEWSMGFASNDRAGTVAQRSVWMAEQEAATSNLLMRSDDRGVIVDGNGAGGLSWYAALGSFDSQGFSVTPSASSGSSTMYYLALRFDNAGDAKVYSYSTPTSTGSASDTGAGFTPAGVIYLTTLLEGATNAGAGITDGKAGTWGLAAINSSAQWSSTVTRQDNVNPSNTQSLSDDQAFNVPLHDGTAGVVGTFSSFGGSGATYSYATVTGTAKWWPAIAFKSGGSQTTPTITLSSPVDTATGVSTTPTLTFYCTDAESDDCRFNLQISDSATFSAGSILVDSYTDAVAPNTALSVHAIYNGTGNDWTGNPQIDDVPGQSFNASVGGKVSTAEFRFGDDAGYTSSGTAYAVIYAHSGTFGATGSSPLNAVSAANTPTHDWLAISDGFAVADAAIPTQAFRSFTFSGANQIRLTAGTKYWAFLRWVPDSTDVTNGFSITGSVDSDDDPSNTHAGIFYNDGANAGLHGTPNGRWDLFFKVYSTFTVTDVVSGADAGFANQSSGGDTDPFNSGDTIGYTVQAALDADVTYYWRVRVKDPAGTDTYSSWSATRSFTTAAGGGGGGTSTAGVRNNKRLLLGVGAAQQQ